MSNAAIRVENLGKRYRIGARQKRANTLRETLQNLVASPFDYLRSTLRGPSEEEIIWALRNISFEVKRGEVVGIIGGNGAGKTTLLKILSCVTEPTEGRAILNGRVASLLAVGTGFHPELTGRENIYLNGAILGMKRSEIDRKFDEIVDFSGVEKFIDTPVKRYSSGMYVRLAFAVAAHLEPEIMLVDEVLAVGDVGFQKKCLGKMEDVARGGRTVLFVSHNMGMITTLCEKAILLTEGRIDFMGPTQQAVSTYLAHFSADAGLKREWSFEDAPGGENVKVRSVAITDHQGIEKPYFSTTEPIFVTIEYWILRDGVPVNIGFWLFDEHNVPICGVGNYTETRSKPITKRGLYRSKCTIPGNLLNSGRHTITVGMVYNRSDSDGQATYCAAFETVDDHRIHSAYSKWGGIIKPDFEWQSKRIGDIDSPSNE